VQEGLARAWEKRHHLRDETRLEAWLFRILHNCWMEYLRRQKCTTDLDEVPPRLDDGPDVSLERQQLADRVRAAVSSLPVGQREVVTLVDLEGCRYVEVADILNIPVGTVMSRLSRARDALRRELLHLRVPGEARQPRLRRVK
jgi:RNA polymerase sigma-70 factor (ECF subfamily)